ncbi:MAG TPA: hypothetical protein PLO13_02110, partial [Anaerolineaceae bacterium]|nr:hypothetical protein [Anaerolineaceae bacterium]
MINDLQQHPSGAGIRSLIDRWQQDQEVRENIAYWQITPAREALNAAIPASLDPQLLEALKALGITQLYSHQAEAVERAHNGE